MDYADSSTLSVLSRGGAEAREWPAILRVADGAVTETTLRPVTTYADAQARMAETSADRLFIPADVLADMVAAGAGPDSSA